MDKGAVVKLGINNLETIASARQLNLFKVFRFLFLKRFFDRTDKNNTLSVFCFEEKFPWLLDSNR